MPFTYPKISIYQITLVKDIFSNKHTHIHKINKDSEPLVYMQNTENKNVKVKMTAKVTAKNNNKNVNSNKAEKYIF